MNAAAAVSQNQIGDELSTLQTAPDPRLKREILLTRGLMCLGIVATLLAVTALGRIVLFRFQTGRTALAWSDAFFALNICFLLYGSVFYQLTRLAYLKRMRTHCRAPNAELERVYLRPRPHPLVILIPSYREELHVVRQTLMSAALTEYPDRRIVLLIDDPPNSPDPEFAIKLAATRQMVRDLDSTLRAHQRRYAREFSNFKRRLAAGPLNAANEGRRLAALYRKAADWIESQAPQSKSDTHYDALYTRRILVEPARAHRDRAHELACGFRDTEYPPTAERIELEYRRLTALFAAPTACFERKRFANLSHAPNKAMNLNSYLGLIGRSFREVNRPDGLFLEECDPEIADLRIPDADYVITLDADSLLLSDYALRLTYVMDQPESARFAVVESPYTSVPDSPGLLERIAGAQTDVQWIGSQGATYYNASFWVGANALLRRSALEDICEIVYERGHAIRRYIQDHTLVEDTEATIDLVARGWQLYCYPERLSYSATPPDFGALVIQRRRWANGPLLIVPKLIRYALSGPSSVPRFSESILRLYTLTSALGAVSMLLMIAFRFPDVRNLPVLWLVISAIPYYILYCRDLMSCGYDWWDLSRMYGLNLLLISVNLDGMIRSLYQAITQRQSAFVRTPKVPGRTCAPALHVLMPLLILGSIAYSTVAAVAEGGWAYGSYGLLNAVCLGYAFIYYVGLDAGLRDATIGLTAGVGVLAEQLDPSVAACDNAVGSDR
jgi:cellulose synthase (UDP-forming)